MPLILTEEQTMLEEAARGFLNEAAPIAHLRQLRDGRDPSGVSRDLWASFGEMGFAGVLVPEAHGGSGLGAVEAGVIAEAVGRNLVPSPFLSTGVLAATALRAGSEEQQRWLPEIAAGRLIAAIAIDEGRKHRPDRIETTAARSGNGWRLDGAKAMVLDGHVADILIVAARTDEGLGLFVVEPKADGVAIERTVMVDAHNAARVTLDGVQVDAGALIGAADGALLRRVLDHGSAITAAEMTGAAQAAYDQTMAYLRERRQFGKAIGEFQALQHRAAHLYAELEITRAAVIRALQLLDSDPEAAGRAVAVAKARAGKSSELAVQEAVQMHGGVGMTDEFDVGLYMKRIRVCQELFGDFNHHADQLARLSGY